MNRNILIAGGSGLVGRVLVRAFLARQDKVTVLTRQEKLKSDRADLHYLLWNPPRLGSWAPYLAHSHIIINLAGQTLLTPWTAAGKDQILQSRLDALQALLQAREKFPSTMPQCFMQASAVGYYGNQNHQLLTEQSPTGETFLAEVCRKVERLAHTAGHDDHQAAILRLGIVLAREGGFLSQIQRAFKFLPAAAPVTRRQFLSWIHIQDLTAAIMHIIDRKMAGTFNLTAPQPLAAKTFYRLLAHKRRRLLLFQWPAPLVRLMLGQFADELVFSSQNALPQQLLLSDFIFRFPTIRTALDDLLNHKE